MNNTTRFSAVCALFVFGLLGVTTGARAEIKTGENPEASPIWQKVRASLFQSRAIATATDEDLGLDDDLVGPGCEERLGGHPGLRGRVGHLPWGDRQTLGEEQRLGVGFLEFHADITVGGSSASQGPSGGSGPTGYPDGTGAAGKPAVGRGGRIGPRRP